LKYDHFQYQEDASLWQVAGSDSGSCPVVGFGINIVETSGSTASVLQFYYNIKPNELLTFQHRNSVFEMHRKARGSDPMKGYIEVFLSSYSLCSLNQTMDYLTTRLAAHHLFSRSKSSRKGGRMEGGKSNQEKDEIKRCKQRKED
jgi:hypothetical protein